jgi:hypothetical protein
MCELMKYQLIPNVQYNHLSDDENTAIDISETAKAKK